MLLAQRDVGALSVDEIVAAADVAKGSFYNHFQDKDAFAREIGAGAGTDSAACAHPLPKRIMPSNAITHQDQPWRARARTQGMKPFL